MTLERVVGCGLVACLAIFAVLVLVLASGALGVGA